MYFQALFDCSFILFCSGTFDIFVKIDGTDKNVSFSIFPLIYIRDLIEKQTLSFVI